jgi:hypothetical protein
MSGAAGPSLTSNISARLIGNDLAEWFPCLATTGVPVPRTVIVQTELDLLGVLDGETPAGFDDFVAQLDAAGREVGGPPAFLRTGHTSGKHGWRRTCYVQGAVARHVAALVEWSACAGLLGLPTSTWAVREFLNLDASFSAFDGMPVALERRLFIEAGAVRCHHPYWPADALEEGRPSRPDWRAKLAEQDRTWDAECGLVLEMGRVVSAAFPGSWSLDFARTRAGLWIALDMANAADSFHWPGCTYQHHQGEP